MKFCENCQRVLTRYIETGEVIFKCVCGNQVVGDPEDSIIHEEMVTADDTQTKYDVFIKNSAHDPVNSKVMRECSKCKVDHMTMIRVGKNRNVLYTCSCGHSEGL